MRNDNDNDNDNDNGNGNGKGNGNGNGNGNGGRLSTAPSTFSGSGRDDDELGRDDGGTQATATTGHWLGKGKGREAGFSAAWLTMKL